MRCMRLTQLRSEPLGRRQVEIADRLIVTKVDEAEEGALARLLATLHRINPGAAISGAVKGSEAALPPWDDAEPEALPDLSGDAERPAIFPTQLVIDETIDWTAFSVWLSALLHARGDDVLRVKGVVRTPAGRLLRAERAQDRAIAGDRAGAGRRSRIARTTPSWSSAAATRATICGESLRYFAGQRLADREDRMSDADVYRKQQFGQKTGFGKTPALLVVDFVNGFHDPDILGGGNIPEAVIATVPLLEFFRATQASGDLHAHRLCRGRIGREPVVREGAALARPHRECRCQPGRRRTRARVPGEVVIRKTQASAFFGTHLGACLVSRAVDTLVVAGCTTSGCVRASVIDAMSMNYRTVVASDCVGDRALGPHAANLFDMGQKYADLLTAAEIIEALSAAS